MNSKDVFNCFSRCFAGFFACAITISLEVAFAMPANYNTMMIGDRSGGMGGAGTALMGDPSAAPYLNPALLSRFDGASVSASVSLFNKNDTVYGRQESLDDAVFRINKGSIAPIPSSSAILKNFRNFAGGLSIVTPYDSAFGGTVAKTATDSTFLRTDRRMLWVGGVLAFNLDEKWSLGMTAYYTSDTSTRSLTNRYDNAGDVIVVNEEKTLTTNSVVYLLGASWVPNSQWRLGMSYRFRSIPVDGKASYLRSQVGTVSGAQPVVEDSNIGAESGVPDRAALGLSYSGAGRWRAALDVYYHGALSYTDTVNYGDRISRRDVWNYAVGFEYAAKDWLDVRFGFFTDSTAAPEIPLAPSRRYEDAIDQLGFSANLAVDTSPNTVVTLGGYYLGGEGHASEEIGAGFQRIEKTQRLFSFLVSSAYRF